MHISDILRQGRTALSFELFPPRTETAREKFEESLRELKELEPDFISVTYGAGGSTRGLTADLVRRLAGEGLEVIPHLTCLGHSRTEVEEILDGYAAMGVSNILALRGDPPQDGLIQNGSDLKQAADLVRLIRGRGDGFGIGIAGFPEGHPGTPNRLKEMDYLKAKADAGADYICTQLFFDNRDFLDFRDRCDLAGIRIPILAGILPVTEGINLQRLADLAAGARFPARFLRKLTEAGTGGEAITRAGIEYAREQICGLMKEGVAGIHLYTMNQSRAARELAGKAKTGRRK